MSLKFCYRTVRSLYTATQQAPRTGKVYCSSWERVRVRNSLKQPASPALHAKWTVQWRKSVVLLCGSLWRSGPVIHHNLWGALASWGKRWRRKKMKLVFGGFNLLFLLFIFLWSTLCFLALKWLPRKELIVRVGSETGPEWSKLSSQLTVQQGGGGTPRALVAGTCIWRRYHDYVPAHSPPCCHKPRVMGWIYKVHKTSKTVRLNKPFLMNWPSQARPWWWKTDKDTDANFLRNMVMIRLGMWLSSSLWHHYWNVSLKILRGIICT